MTRDTKMALTWVGALAAIAVALVIGLWLAGVFEVSTPIG